MRDRYVVLDDVHDEGDLLAAEARDVVVGRVHGDAELVVAGDQAQVRVHDQRQQLLVLHHQLSAITHIVTRRMSLSMAITCAPRSGSACSPRATGSIGPGRRLERVGIFHIMGT